MIIDYYDNLYAETMKMLFVKCLLRLDYKKIFFNTIDFVFVLLWCDIVLWSIQSIIDENYKKTKKNDKIYPKKKGKNVEFNLN